jgi:hypothetical protein
MDANCEKREYVHMINCIVSYISDWFPGSKHEFSIFLERKDFYQTLLHKTDDSGQIWSILADKGYEGMKNIYHVLF